MAKRTPAPQIAAVLHNIRSLHNVGSIFRTADAAGVSMLWLCGVTPAPRDRFGRVPPPLAKVALGAEETVPWRAERQAGRVLKNLKKEGYEIWALEQAPGAAPYHEARLPRNRKIALLLGEETKGLPSRILRLADRAIEIPMFGAKESLNVSVAFGIAVYRLRLGGGV